MIQLQYLQNRRIKYLFFCSALVLITVFGTYAQEVQKKSYLTNTFTDKQLINNQTTEIPSGLEFRIQHRFGGIGFNEDIIKEFLGLDLPANIRFSLAYPLIKERLYISIGRTKYDKVWDFEVKYLWLRQTEKNEIPLSIAIYHNTAINSDAYRTIPDNAFFSDSTTAFKNKFAHRASYNTQIIIARKFSEKLSFQVSPVMIYQNLAAPGRENMTFALPVGGRYKFSRNSAVVIEYAFIFNNRTDGTINPLSLGVEFGTAGHVFQFFMTSSNRILEQNIYTKNSFDYTEGLFALGFNIRRTWWF